MKTLQLHQEYSRMSRLCKEDEKLFTNLLKGGFHHGFIKRSISDFFIVPVHLGSHLVCNGFIIEHHQLFFSQSGQLYLVFYPIRSNYWPNPWFVPKYNVYEVQNSTHQKGCIHLCRRQDFVCAKFPLFGSMLIN